MSGSAQFKEFWFHNYWQKKLHSLQCKKLLYADFPPRASHPPEKLINFVIIAPVTDPSESITGWYVANYTIEPLIRVSILERRQPLYKEQCLTNSV